jgi:hypothetical protein
MVTQFSGNCVTAKLLSVSPALTRVDTPCWHGSTLYVSGATASRAGPRCPTTLAEERSCFGVGPTRIPSSRSRRLATLV